MTEPRPFKKSMAAFVLAEGGKYRVCYGSAATSPRLYKHGGSPVDEGGFDNRADAARLVEEINHPKTCPWCSKVIPFRGGASTGGSPGGRPWIRLFAT